MKLLQRLTVLLFLIVALLFAGTQFYARVLTDTAPPVISFDRDVIEVSVSASESDLLQGVSAVDKADGDLTDQIMIQSITQLLTEDSVKVTYLVFDSANNFSTATRTVRYTDYEKPKFSLSEPLVYPLRGNLMILDRLHAVDAMDGDISDNIRISSQDLSPYSSGTQTFTVQVINALGDQELIPLKLVVLNTQNVMSTLHLSEYIVYLNQGDSYDPTHYITYSADPDSVQIDSNVDTSTPGAYHTGYKLSTLLNPGRSDQYYTYMVYQTVVVR